MTDCQSKLDEITHTGNSVLDMDLAALQRMPERSRIEKYNDIKADEEELRWEYGKECPNYLTNDSKERIAGELTLARLLLAASFYQEGGVPAAMADDFIEAELEAVVEFDRFKQFDALDEDQIEERVRRMEGEVYELVQEYTSTQIANMDELIDNPDVQQGLIERLVDRYDDRRERIRQGFFVYVETHGLGHMVESIEDAVGAVSDATAEREEVQQLLEKEFTDLETTVRSGFNQQKLEVETELSRVEREIASEAVDTATVQRQLQEIDTIDDDALDRLDTALSRTRELKSRLDQKIKELEAARKEAMSDGMEESEQEAVDVVDAELDRLRDQRSELEAEITRLETQREEIESARERLDQRQQSLEQRAKEIDSAGKGGGIDGSDVVTASTARLFEMDYLGRFETNMFEVPSIILPNGDFDVPDGYWEGRSERRSETTRMRNLLQKYDSDPSETHPTNPTARYTITESKYLGLSERAKMIIEATVVSHLEPHAINGFDSEPANLEDLLSFVNSAVDEASDEEIPYVLGIASPTGWTEEVQNLVVDDDIARTRFSRHVSVCLVDLKSGSLMYDSSDPVITENIGLFERAVQAENVDDCVSMIRSEYATELGRETVMVEEIVEKTEYESHVIRQAFDRIESSGDGEQFYVDERGLAMDFDT